MLRHHPSFTRIVRMMLTGMLGQSSTDLDRWCTLVPGRYNSNAPMLSLRR